VPPRASSNPHPPGERAGEGALLVAEELGLEQVGRERTAVHDEEGVVLAARLAVDGLRGLALPGPGLSLEEHGHVGGGRALHQGEAHPRGNRAAHQRAEAGVLGELELGLLAGELEAQAHPPELEEAPVSDRGLLHQHAVEHGAVAAPQILGPDALLVDQELAVEARHGALVEQHVVQRVTPDGGPLAGGLEALSHARSIDDPEPEPPHVGDQAGPADAEGRRRVGIPLGRGRRGDVAAAQLVGNFPTLLTTGHPHPRTYLEHTWEGDAVTGGATADPAPWRPTQRAFR